MNIDGLKIISWNANGLHQHLLELKQFLKDSNIDIALISETHSSNKHFLKIQGYTIYETTHPDGTGHGGTAVIIKNRIKWIEPESSKTQHIQATSIQIIDGSGPLTIAPSYFPPKYLNSIETSGSTLHKLFKNVANTGLNKFVKNQFQTHAKSKCLTKTTDHLVGAAVKNLYRDMPQQFQKKRQQSINTNNECKNMAPISRFYSEKRKHLIPPDFKPNQQPCNNNSPKLTAFWSNKNYSNQFKFGQCTHNLNEKNLLKPKQLRKYNFRRCSSSMSSSRASVMRRLDYRKQVLKNYEPLQQSFLHRAFSTQQSIDRKINALATRSLINKEQEQQNDVKQKRKHHFQLKKYEETSNKQTIMALKDELMPMNATIRKLIQVKPSQSQTKLQEPKRNVANTTWATLPPAIADEKYENFIARKKLEQQHGRLQHKNLWLNIPTHSDLSSVQQQQQNATHKPCRQSTQHSFSNLDDLPALNTNVHRTNKTMFDPENPPKSWINNQLKRAFSTKINLATLTNMIRIATTFHGTQAEQNCFI